MAIFIYPKFPSLTQNSTSSSSSSSSRMSKITQNKFERKIEGGFLKLITTKSTTKSTTKTTTATATAELCIPVKVLQTDHILPESVSYVGKGHRGTIYQGVYTPDTIIKRRRMGQSPSFALKHQIRSKISMNEENVMNILAEQVIEYAPNFTSTANDSTVCKDDHGDEFTLMCRGDESLGNYLKKKKSISPEIAFQLIYGLLVAKAIIGFRHVDLNFQNILIKEEGPSVFHIYRYDNFIFLVESPMVVFCDIGNSEMNSFGNYSSVVSDLGSLLKNLRNSSCGNANSLKKLLLTCNSDAELLNLLCQNDFFEPLRKDKSWQPGYGTFHGHKSLPVNLVKENLLSKEHRIITRTAANDDLGVTTDKAIMGVKMAEEEVDNDFLKVSKRRRKRKR